MSASFTMFPQISLSLSLPLSIAFSMSSAVSCLAFFAVSQRFLLYLSLSFLYSSWCFLYCPYCTVQYTSCALYALQSTQLRQEPQCFEWFQQYCRYRMTLLYYCTILLYCCEVRTWTNSDSHILTALLSPNLHANEWYWTHKCWCLGCHMGCIVAVCMLLVSLVAIGSLKQSREIVWT